MGVILRSGLLFGITISLAGFGSCPPPPPAKTPVLEVVFKPGPSLTNIGVDPSGEFQVLPSSSVIIWFRAPVLQGLTVAVNGVTLEQTSSVARQQTLESQGLGFWFHRPGSPNVNVTGDARWDIAVAAPPALRVSQRFTITLTGTTSNATTPTSAPLTVRVAIGIPDWVSIPFNPRNDDAVVLLDGRRTSGCEDDELWRGKRIIDVGDIRSRGSCNEEMVVFTKGNAVQLVDRTITGLWTDSLRDFVAADANTSLWSVPVDVWLLRPRLRTTAAVDFARATVVYDNSRCGISFSPTFNDVSSNSTAATLFGTDITTMENQAWRDRITRSAFFTAGRINVYYVGVPFTGRSASGFTARPNYNIIGMASTADVETLAHELGHSFSLLHSDGISGIPSTNIMMPGGSGRNEFTKGQCFRMSLNRTSTINTNLVRGGWVRDCPDGTTNATCPPLSFDVP